MGINLLVSTILKSKFTKFSKIPFANGLPGKEIADKMRRENGIFDVKVISADAFVTRECGHAVQYASANGLMKLRSKLVPAVQISSMLVNWILLAGIIVLATTKSPIVLLVGIVAIFITVLFTLITLPDEFDASKRALAWLSKANITNQEEYPKAKMH